MVGKRQNGEVFRGLKGQDLVTYLMCLAVEKWGKGEGIKMVFRSLA